ncbi:hypothetical protein [Cryobacterium sp. TMS1-13-1]|uniref:single-stranded DNA-binding protein n=1 Tax=Cryobacterium sp. TMS1-13-1 TaxID=1259220 RepID=UPI0015840915|nr:hypothetical protein [Cryobacterium sp. TMS1-13-1]
MTLHTQQSLSGFIASDPQHSVTENGDIRFYVRVGQPHFRREYCGSFTALEPTFHGLVAYRATAERALIRFAKGDSFVAKKIGDDLARTNYQVDRTHRFISDTDIGPEVETRLNRLTPVRGGELAMSGALVEWASEDHDDAFREISLEDLDGPRMTEPPHPINWNLLSDWVAISGTRLERDRPTRQTAWPGEPPADAVEDVVIGDRDEDFVQFVVEHVARQRESGVTSRRLV